MSISILFGLLTVLIAQESQVGSSEVKRTKQGKVTRVDDNDVVVAVEEMVKHPIYGKYVLRTRKHHASVQNHITVNLGDTVEIAEIRPVSKTKYWTVVKVITDHEAAVGMLIITRRVGEAVVIGDNAEVSVKVLGVKGNQVRFGIKAPRGVQVMRQEILLGMQTDGANDYETAVDMLVISRRAGEAVVIGDNAEVSVTMLGIKGNQVRVGINAPREVSVLREEIWGRMQVDGANEGGNYLKAINRALKQAIKAALN